MNPEPPPLPPKKSLTLPVVLAFVPSVLVLLMFTLNLSNSQLAACCLPAVLVSLACCFTSSFMLIRRNTSGGVAFGILLGLLNLVISAGIGCAALLTGANLH